MMPVVMVIIAFLSGALPLAVWVGRLALQTDIRSYGDGNPGTFNVLRAGGFWWGALAFGLEVMKAFVPVAFANFVLTFSGPELVAVSIAPLLGHAFSPFLKFRGGKTVAATFGVWCGLTIWEGPSVFGILLGFWYVFINDSGWAVILAALSLLVYLLLVHRDPVLLAVWVGNFLIFAWKHRAELIHVPTLRPWYRNLSWRS